MNKAEQKAQRDASRIVRVTNPYDFDFTHAYGGIPYTLPMGKPLLLPFPLADHLTTHLVRQAIIRKAPKRDANETDGRGSDRPLWTDESIEAIKKGIMIEEYQEEATHVLTPEEIMAKKIEDLNKRFDDMEALKAETGDTTPATSSDPATTTDPVISDATTYKDKAEVIAELDKRGIKYDARASKANLEQLLLS